MLGRWCRYAAEVSRLKSGFRAEAQADVDAMREAVGKYQELWQERAAHVERLGMQKRLLIQQVGGRAGMQRAAGGTGQRLQRVLQLVTSCSAHDACATSESTVCVHLYVQVLSYTV